MYRGIAYSGDPRFSSQVTVRQVSVVVGGTPVFNFATKEEILSAASKFVSGLNPQLRSTGYLVYIIDLITDKIVAKAVEPEQPVVQWVEIR